MKLDLTTPRVVEWLAQFDTLDQSVASELLSEILLVDADELTTGLRQMLLTLAEEVEGPIALYSERHIRRHLGKPNRLFTEQVKRGVRRAVGNGPPPVPAGRPYARETGSEGVIATLITGLARSSPKLFLDHPGPDQIRAKRAKAYVVVTDFIGSGRRCWDNLEAAWKVRSFKSWRSYGLLQFAVAAYSGTEAGVKTVADHRSRPKVLLRKGCPTVRILHPSLQKNLLRLLEKYGPKPKTDDRTVYGYGDAGALIAFDHGMPNNAPLLLHTETPRWTPLFPRRSAALLTSARRASSRMEEIDRALSRLREKRLSVAPRFADIGAHEQDRIVLLTALKRRPRTGTALSARTGLSIMEVELHLAAARSKGYIDGKMKLTQAAYDALEYLKTSDPPKAPLLKTIESLYVPLSMRPPRGQFR